MSDAERIALLESAVRTLWLALAFYGDPDSYFAVGIFPDAPCGEFADDFSYCESMDREVHGKRARETLDSLTNNPAVMDVADIVDESGYTERAIDAARSVAPTLTPREG